MSDHLTLFYSSIGRTKKVAQDMSDLAEAETDTERESSFAGCSVILQAAILDQGTQTVIRHLANLFAVENGVRYASVPFYHNINAPLWERVRYIPKLLSNDEYELDIESARGRELRDLIPRRNRLLHINDFHYAGSVDNNSRNVTVDFGADAIHLTVEAPLPEWYRVKAPAAKKSLEAVIAYCQQVLFGEPVWNGDSDEVSILKARRGTRSTFNQLSEQVHALEFDLERLAWISV